MSDVVEMTAPSPLSRQSPPAIHFGPEVHFGIGGNADSFVLGGWSGAEPEFRWMISLESELRIDQPFDRDDYLIELDVIPLLSPPRLLLQRLTVSVNGWVVGHSTIEKIGRFGYRVPAAALAGRTAACILLSHPDAARPCDLGQSDDDRSLSLAVKRLRLSRLRSVDKGLRLQGTGGMALSQLQPALGMEPDQLMLNFESVGDNCEFGLVQRRCGADPLGLLRFSDIQTQTLIRGLDAGFQDFGLAANVELRLEDKEPPEYFVHEKRYDIIYHTFRYRDEVNPERLLAREPARLAFLVRKLLEDLKDGDMIFVCKRNIPLTEDEILPVYAALNAHGRNTLLWLVAAGAQDAAGSVEVVMPGLLKGFLDRFAPYENAYDLSFESWLEVCANAWRLSRTEACRGLPERVRV